MTASQNQCHRIKFSPINLLSGKVYKNNSGNMKGLTCYTMMVIRGCPVDTNIITAATSDCKIDFDTMKVYRLKTILDDCSKLNAVHNLLT